MSKPRVVAVIPARGGSVSIPLKNIKPLLGRPLIDWCIRAALDSGIFDDVYVSTDHDDIAAAAMASGAKVHRRSEESASNTASTELAMIDFVDAHQDDFEILCLIQATSPLVMPEHFQEAPEKFVKDGADSMVTAVRAHRFLWKVDPESGSASAINYEPSTRPRRQDWNGELIENGAFYFTSKELFNKERCRLGGKISLFEMPEHTLLELDSEVDWQIVCSLCQAYGHKPEVGK